jgi:hypothetical protein
MELDDFKSAWATLERSLAINERLLREVMLRKVRFWQVPFVIARALEVIVFGAMLVATLSVMSWHGLDARYLVVGGGLAVYLGGLTGMCAFQMVTMLRLDYGAPITALQRDTERIKLSEVWAFGWRCSVDSCAGCPPC